MKELFARSSYCELRSFTNCTYQSNFIIPIRKKTERPLPRVTKLDGKRFSEQRSIFLACIVVIFLSVSISIGVIIVSLTLLKRTDIDCTLVFKRSAQHSIGYDSLPQHVAFEDLNNDGNLDMVVAALGIDCIGIFIGYGNGSFHFPIMLTTGFTSRPYYVIIDDFNNDTVADIAVANYGTNSIGIFIGYRNATFASQILTSLGSSRPVSLASGDFNKDKQLDIAVVNYGTSTVSVLYGFNNGSFEMTFNYYMGHDSIPCSLAVADLNNDTNLDIAVVNSGTSELIILLASNDGTFMMSKYSTGRNAHPHSVVIADSNHDNKYDVIIANTNTSNIGIFLGTGEGKFSNVVFYSIGLNSHPQYIAIGYLTNSTKLNIVVVDSENKNIIILEDNQHNNFSIVTVRSTGPTSNPGSITIGDFDTDGKEDVAVTIPTSNQVQILTSFGTFRKLHVIAYSLGNSFYPNAIDVGDFNNDNNLDMAVTQMLNNNIAVLINLGNESFRYEEINDASENSYERFIKIGDINNDQYLDIITLVETNKVRTLLGYGNGSFHLSSNYIIGDDVEGYTARLGDIDIDGNLDIIINGALSTGLVIFFGNGDGTFTRTKSDLYKLDFIPMCIDVNDFNNDGILDIVTSDGIDNRLVVLLGYGNRSFSSPINTEINDAKAFHFLAKDLNKDSYLDIVYIAESPSHIGVLFGNGNGTFRNLTTYSLPCSADYHSNIIVGYFNNDTMLDAALLCSNDYRLCVLFGSRNGEFAMPPVLYSTGHYSYGTSIAFGDFNNDNKMDIAIAHATSGKVIICYVESSSDFENERMQTIGSGPHPAAVIARNLNDGDDQLDIVVANSGHDNIEILSNYNNAIFINRSVLYINEGSKPQSIVVADFNNDNIVDIAAVNGLNNSINFFFGFHNGSFSPPYVYSFLSHTFPSSIISGDFNNDARIDIATVDQRTDTLCMFLAFDYVSFINNVIVTADSLYFPKYVLSVDFNNDHFMDLVVFNQGTNTIVIFLGYGNGSFSNETIRLSSSSPSSNPITVGDFNDDNYVDIIAINTNTNSINTFLGRGDGTFEPEIRLHLNASSHLISVATGDFNNDSILDLVAADTVTEELHIFLGNGNGTFSKFTDYKLNSTSGQSVWITVGHINNDQFMDIAVVLSSIDCIGLYFGIGDGTFGNITLILTGSKSWPSSISFADFNHDNITDMAVSNRLGQSISIYFGYGDGMFWSKNISLYETYPMLNAIHASDMNNDTIMDILVVDYGTVNSSIAIFYGLGNGTFTQPKTYSAGTSLGLTMMAIADYNSDGKMDIIVTYSNQNKIAVFLQKSKEPFGTQSVYSLSKNSAPSSLAAGDFNNDNHLDIAIANSGMDNIGILLGYGNGSFSESITISTGTNSFPVSIGPGQMNRDAFLDIVVVNLNTNNVLILFGHGNGSFLCTKNYSVGLAAAPSFVRVGDLNRDNELDIIVANYGTNNILIFFGIGDGNLSTPQTYSLGYNARPRSIDIGDINNDHFLDIIVANYGTHYVEILFQSCST